MDRFQHVEKLSNCCNDRDRNLHLVSGSSDHQVIPLAVALPSLEIGVLFSALLVFDSGDGQESQLTLIGVSLHHHHLLLQVDKSNPDTMQVKMQENIG